MARYERINSQPNRLGEFVPFGQWGGGEMSAAITAVSNGVVGTVTAITKGKVLIAQSRHQRQAAIHVKEPQNKQKLVLRV